jgi:hypothetical protein
MHKEKRGLFADCRYVSQQFFRILTQQAENFEVIYHDYTHVIVDPSHVVSLQDRRGEYAYFGKLRSKLLGELSSS